MGIGALLGAVLTGGHLRRRALGALARSQRVIDVRALAGVRDTARGIVGSRRQAWTRLERDITHCERCVRLREHCLEVARVKRRAYADQDYWGRPVPGFGDTSARILLLGLAPGAHGANRTGRMFTGDRSGEWLYAALHRAGLANHGDSRHVDDGLTLSGAFISAACRCAPPANRPTRDELDRCATFLDRELELLDDLRVVLALGQIAWDAALRRVQRIAPGSLSRPRPRFGHDARVAVEFRRPGESLWLVGSYHPSQQNTQTGRLTRNMLDSVIRRSLRLAS